jgi:hypothetical protein
MPYRLRSGRIVGHALFEGKEHGYMLVPVAQ